MPRSLMQLLATALSMIMLAGCSHPETPQEVAAAFWQAMADNDAGDVVEYSTLADEAAFDSYKRSWTNVVPSFGRVVIDDGSASVVTRLPAEDGPEGERLELITWLVRDGENWVVDYRQTGEAIVNPSPFRNLMGELNRLGEQLSESLKASSGELEQGVNELARQLEAYSDTMGRKAEGAVQDFGQQLQKAMKALQKSLEQALEQDNQATPDDRVILEQAARDLDARGDALDEPTLDALADAGRTLAETGEQLTRLSDATLTRHRDQWQASLAEIRTDIEAFFSDLSESFSSDPH